MPDCLSLTSLSSLVLCLGPRPEPTRVKHHFSGLLNQTEKTCQGQTLKLIFDEEEKKLYIIDTSSH